MERWNEKKNKNMNKEKKENPPSTLRFTISPGLSGLVDHCILIRCAYRVAELKDGYDGALICDDGVFIGLEGA